jgi:transcriptional regulator with XRE-family HTH domain
MNERPVSTIAKEFGRQIEAFRLSRNLRQEDISKATGISRTTIVRIESGQGGTIDSLIRLLKALGAEDRLHMLVPDARLRPLDPRFDAPARQRARPAGGTSEPKQWRWDDE